MELYGKQYNMHVDPAILISNLWKVFFLIHYTIRSLLCTATNATPHDRLFIYSRHSSSGVSIPSWLSNSEPLLLKRHTLQFKYDPLVDEVELLESNPRYAHIRYRD